MSVRLFGETSICSARLSTALSRRIYRMARGTRVSQGPTEASNPSVAIKTLHCTILHAVAAPRQHSVVAYQNTTSHFSHGHRDTPASCPSFLVDHSCLSVHVLHSISGDCVPEIQSGEERDAVIFSFSFLVHLIKKRERERKMERGKEIGQ